MREEKKNVFLSALSVLSVVRNLLRNAANRTLSAGNDAKLLYLATLAVVNLLEKQIPTLICCGAGMSRSPAIAAAALSLVFQQPPDDSLKEVAEYHSADVVPALWAEVKSVITADE